MSTSGITSHQASTGPSRGHTLGVRSLLMLPLLLVSGAVGGVVGFILLGFKNLEGSEPMSEQGAYGWMVLAVSTLLLMTPMIVGVVLGAKARKQGERRLGTIGMVIDGAILVGYTTLVFSSAAT